MALDLSVKSCYTSRYPGYDVAITGAMDLSVTRSSPVTKVTKPSVRFASQLTDYCVDAPASSPLPAKTVSWCVKRKLHELTRGSGVKPQVTSESRLDGDHEVPSKRMSPGLESQNHRCQPDNTTSRCQSDTSDRHDNSTPDIALDNLVIKCAPSSSDRNTLPNDPREWSREDVHTWLSTMQSRLHLGHVQQQRFLMNGKALCLMSVRMFSDRVPEGGALLFRDFQARVNKAVAAARCRS